MPVPTTPSKPGFPAADYAGPFDEFYGDRRYVGKDNNEVWLLRQHLRGDTSEEEGLEWTEYCSVCGSECCRRRPGVCKEQDRIGLLRVLVLGVQEYAN